MVGEGSAGNSRSRGGKLLGERGQLPEKDKEKVFTKNSGRGRQNTTAVVEIGTQHRSTSGQVFTSGPQSDTSLILLHSMSFRLHLHAVMN